MKKIKKININYIEDDRGKRKIYEYSKLDWNRRKLIHKFIDDDENLITEVDLNIERYKMLDDNLRSILFIGPQRINGVHFIEKLYDQFKERDYIIEYISPHDLRDLENSLQYTLKEELCPLSKVLKRCKLKPDLIFIEECTFWWDNDVDIPVFYKHREFKRPPTVYYPNVAFFWHDEVIDFFKKILAPHWCSKVKYLKTMHIAVDPTQYKPKKKTYKGINHIGYREDITEKKAYEFPELSNIADLILLKREEDEVKEIINCFNTPITDKKYRELLPKCEALWIPLSTKQYTTRRMLEAMACKTLCYIKIENKTHIKILENMGFNIIENIKCIDELKNMSQLKYEYSQTMIDKAYKKTLKNHTFKNRAEQIIDLYKELGYTSERFDVICPVYWVNEFFEENVKTWFNEIPINNLYLGVNNSNLEINIDHPCIKVIDQTDFFTLGKCLSDLMSCVETPWFVYLHADARPFEGSFDKLKRDMVQDVGIIESERLHWNGNYIDGKVPDYTYTNYHDRKRSFSGYQLFRKEAIETILDKIDDDFIYRNEDIIFHSECIENGYQYKKNWALHIHQVIEQKWTFKKNETYAMQMYGLIKYTQPHKFTRKALFTAIQWCQNNLPEEWDLTIDRMMYFCFENNPNWAELILENWDNVKEYLEGLNDE